MRESVKHRFIGAAVLAAIAVLFLPGFFKDKQAYEVDTSSHIPTRPSITAVGFDEPEQVEDIEPAPAPDTMFIPSEADALPLAAEASEPAAQPAATVASATPASSSLKDVAPMPLNDQGLPDAWVIQVASLSTKEAATKLRDQLQKDGYKAYLRSVSGQNIHRVFIGPKLDKGQALTLKAELDKRLKVNSLVLPFKP